MDPVSGTEAAPHDCALCRALLAMAAGVAATVILGGIEFVPPWEPLPLTAPRPYVIAVYAALALMIWGVHIPALLRAFRRETLQ